MEIVKKMGRPWDNIYPRKFYTSRRITINVVLAVDGVGKSLYIFKSTITGLKLIKSLIRNKMLLSRSEMQLKTEYHHNRKHRRRVKQLGSAYKSV